MKAFEYQILYIITCSALKLVHMFSINPHLGPLQISLGRMVIDIVKFFFIYTLVLFAFACGKYLQRLAWLYGKGSDHFECFYCFNFTSIFFLQLSITRPFPLLLIFYFLGLNQLLWYFSDLERKKCYHFGNGLADWDGAGDACMKWRRFAK